MTKRLFIMVFKTNCFQKIYIFGILFAVVACSDKPVQKAPQLQINNAKQEVSSHNNISTITDIKKHDRFTRNEVAGYTLEEIAEKFANSYSFQKDGYVIATLWNAEGGVAGPILNWEINQQGLLVIDYYDFKQFWTKLSEKNGIIEVKCANGPRKPYRVSYNITKPDGGWLYDKHSRNNSFASAELSGNVILLWFDSLYPQYKFNQDGTGVFTADKMRRNPKDDWSFKWSVDSKGILKITDQYGEVTLWRKISRKNDVIETEITNITVYPPHKLKFRKIKDSTEK
jgi:hypothetical protein